MFQLFELLVEKIRTLKLNKATLAIVAAFVLVIGIMPVTASINPGGNQQEQVFNDPIPGCMLDDVFYQGTCPPSDPEPPVNGGECAGAPALAIHQQFLAELDPYFHNDGWQTWFHQAGFSADAVEFQARQPEEDSFDLDGDLEGDVNYVSGLQVNGRNIEVIWPNVVTTNDPGRITKKLDGYHDNLVDSDGEGSTQYTNVIANGEVTVYASGFSWSQLSTPFECVQPDVDGNVHSGFTGAAGAQPTPPSTDEEETGDWCLTERQLDKSYGIDRNAKGTDNGLLKENGRYEGAVIHVTPKEARELRDHGWTIQGSNPDIKSAWNPPSCR